MRVILPALVAACCTVSGTAAAAIVVIEGTVALEGPRDIEGERVVFRRSAVLVTNGFKVRLRTREIAVDGEAWIRSFAGRSRGGTGRSAGQILIVADRVTGGRLQIVNEGEPGRPGRPGAAGAPGAPGAAGQSCRRTDFGIVQLGTPGGAGAAGGEGEPGAPGSAGGAGGVVLLDIREGARNVLVSVAGGRGGAGGAGGPGGPGGPGGLGTPENAWGPATPPGPAGLPGRPGLAGPPGPPGAPGHFDLLRAAIEPQPATPSFPWPPPRASAHIVLDPAFFAGRRTFDEVGQQLTEAFRKAGYPRESWYAVPDGFALVSQMEQFADDGAPREEAVRFSRDVAPPPLFSLTAFLRALFTASPGRFRIIVFVFTSVPFTQTGAAVDRDTAADWVTGGLNVLPAALGARPYSPAHRCTALVYEFEKPSPSQDVHLMDPSALSGEQHLKRAGLWDPLARKP